MANRPGKSDVQAGDRYEFLGIGDRPEDVTTELLVVGLLLDGKLHGIAKNYQDGEALGHRDWMMPYSEFLLLGEQGVIKEIE